MILRKYVPFLGLCLGFFIVMMDTTTVPFLYTTLMKLFHVGPGAVAWVNNSYLIAYAVLLPLGGKLGDATDRKFILLAGYFAIGFGAMLSGFAHTFSELIVGRILMGMGSGLITPQSMAYISAIFTDGNRGTALGIWGGVAGTATALGPVITQLFLATTNWRWVMWLNVPIALASFAIAARYLSNERGTGFNPRELLSTTGYGLSLAIAIGSIQLINTKGVTTILGGATLAIGIIATLLIIRNDLKKKHGYILASALWVNRFFLRVCTTSALLGAGLTAIYLPLAFLLDIRMAYGPVAISVIMVTTSLSNAIASPFAGKLSDHIAPEKIIRIGLVIFALANLLLGLIGVFLAGGSLAFIALLFAMILSGVGTGLAFAPLANLALKQTGRSNVGQAMAFYNSSRQVLSALSGVIIAILFDWIVQFQLGNNIQITTARLQTAPSATAIAALGSFLLIAISQLLASYIINKKAYAIDKKVSEA